MTTDTDTQGVALEPKGLEAALEAANELTCGGGAPVRDYVAGIIRAYLSAVGGEAGEPALCQYEFEDGTIDHYAGCFGEIHEVNGKKVVRRTPLYLHAPAPTARLKAQPGVVKALEELAQRIDADGTASQIGSAEEIREILSALSAPVSQEPVAWSDDFVERVAISLHDQDADSAHVAWEKQPSKYRTQTRKIVRDVLNAQSIVSKPIGEVKSFAGSLNDLAHIVWTGACPPIGTKLYASPQPSEGEPSDAEVWKPIETAPRDGTKILVYYDADSDPYFAEDEGKLTNYGAHAEGGDFLDGNGVCVAVWADGWYESTDEYGSGFWMPGWWFAWFNGDTDYAIAPTHWMPLPSAPLLAAKSKGGEK